MVQGGAGNTDHTEEFVKNIVKFVQENEDLKKDVKEFLKNKSTGITDLKDLNNPEKAAELFNNTEGQKLLKTIIGHPEFAKLIAQAGKEPNITQKADSLGKRLTIGIGGLVLGGILVGAFGIAAVPFTAIGVGALIVVAAIGSALFSLFKNTEKIGESIQDAGEKVKHWFKNVIDKLPFRSSNAVNYLAQFEPKEVQEAYSKATGKLLPDDAAFVKQYFLNEGGFKALEDLITEKNAKGEKFTVKDEENKDVELTVDNLKVLKEKGDSTHTEADNNKFKEKLGEFKLIMSETNKGVREEVEARQVENAKQYPEKPTPDSALYHGSIANTALLKEVGNANRISVSVLLEKVAELRDIGEGANNGFRKDFHRFAQKTYGLDTSKLEGKNSAELQPLAEQLKKLTPGQIKALNAEVDELKKNQDRGPKTQKDQVLTPQKYTQVEEPGLKV